MNSEIKILADEIRHIRAQYEAEVGANRRRVWPRAIKDRVMKLCELVGSVKEAAELVGISTDSVYAWRSNSKAAGFKKLTVIKSGAVSEKCDRCGGQTKIIAAVEHPAIIKKNPYPSWPTVPCS